MILHLEIILHPTTLLLAKKGSDQIFENKKCCFEFQLIGIHVPMEFFEKDCLYDYIHGYDIRIFLNIMTNIEYIKIELVN